jgi:uncharacterized protein YijF (DUF1287 family)
MQDVEVESLVSEAGYQFEPAIGRYVLFDAAENELDYPTEEIADQLGIPVDDLIRWEEQQVAAAEAGES